MRLNKFLAHAGVASRRKVDELIEAGKVLVNGKKAVLGQKIDPQKDEISVSGKSIKFEEELEYLILNKPIGVTSTVLDKHAKKTVLDIIKGTIAHSRSVQGRDKAHSGSETSSNKEKPRLYPVGRLDQNSKGLILLTNDGDLANRLTHPRYHVEKVYEVLFMGKISPEKIGRIEAGIELEEGKTKEAKVKVKTQDNNKTLLEITLFEGRKRQIRRMAEKLHLHILSLKRTSIGPIKLGSLESGKFRKLTNEEISALKKSAGL